MDILLTTSLAGSLVMGWYIVLKIGIKEKFFSRFRQCVLKLSVVFFLVPFGLLYSQYRLILNIISGNYFNYFISRINMSKGSISLKNVIEVSESGKILFVQNKEFYYLLGAFIAVLIVFMDKQMRNYIKGCRDIYHNSKSVVDEEILEIFKKSKEKAKVKRNIRLKVWKEAGTPFVMGVIRPCIVISGDTLSKDEYEMIFLHEFSHVKNFDIVWKIISTIALIANWYNPLVYYLRHEMNLCCEIISDEDVVKERDVNYRRAYGKLIISMAEEKSAKTPDAVAAFGRPSRFMKVRISKMLSAKNRNYYERSIALGLLLVIIVTNSFTILAYDAPNKVVVGEDKSTIADGGTDIMIAYNRVAMTEEKNDSEFSLDGATIIETQGSETYVKFIDLAGMVYPVSSILDTETGKEESQVACEHNYISGYLQVHEKDLSGSCNVTVYNAEICTLCNQVIKKEKYSQAFCPVCTHER